MIRFAIIVLTLAALSYLPLAGRASGQFVSEQREKTLRSLIPDAEIADDPRLILYTEREVPRAYQFAGPGDRTAGVHDAMHNISGDADEAAKGHGNGGNGFEFPWRRPGGTDRTKGVDSFKFIQLPIGKPIVWYTADSRGHCDNNLGVTRVYRWMFPIGTKIGEVLTWKIGQYDYPFELRIRERLADKWAVDILRPYPTSQSLLEAVSGISDFAGKATLVEHLTTSRPLPVRTLTDAQHRTQRAINVKSAVDELPAIPDEITIKLLSKRPWKSALGETWRDACFAPSGGITPVGYDATFLGSDQTSCKRCHESAGQHVDTFDTPRNWYGFVRGGDKILSFHPFDPRCISGNGGYQPVRMRNIPSVIERFDRSRHSDADYRELPE